MPQSKQIPLEFKIETEQPNDSSWRVAYIVQSQGTGQGGAGSQQQARVMLPQTYTDQQEAVQQAVEIFTSMLAGQVGGQATSTGGGGSHQNR